MLTFAAARPSYTQHRFAFGGVRFEVEADEALRWQLCPEFGQHACEADAFPLGAQVECCVTVDPSLAGRAHLASRCFTVERRGEATETTVVVSPDLYAELEADGPGRYVASVRVAPRVEDDIEPRGPDAVALALSATILEREGGLSLHAAAIELEGRAVLFIGPSGAGKSTAATLAAGCPVFASDRVNITPDGLGGYMAWSLPGGTSVAVPFSAHRRLPLAAIFRVRQSHGAPRVEKLSAARATFAVRESMWLSDFSPMAEEHRIDAAALLRARIPVGEIYTVFGHSHAALLVALVSEPLARRGSEACEGCAS
jgi:hypothetical protein